MLFDDVADAAYFVFLFSLVGALVFHIYGPRSGKSRVVHEFEKADSLVAEAIGRALGDPSWGHDKAAGRITFENVGNVEKFLVDGKLVASIKSETADTPTGERFTVVVYV